MIATIIVRKQMFVTALLRFLHLYTDMRAAHGSVGRLDADRGTRGMGLPPHHENTFTQGECLLWCVSIRQNCQATRFRAQRTHLDRFIVSCGRGSRRSQERNGDRLAAFRAFERREAEGNFPLVNLQTDVAMWTLN